MTKKQYLIAGGISALILLAGVGLWLRHDHKPARAKLSDASGASQNVIPLGGDQNEADTGGLSVSAGGASNLGQLGGNQSGQGSGTSGSSGGSSNQSIDPAQFAQYDKYKDSSSALFGDIKRGDGAELTAGKKAAVYYRGWLTNGQLFDQSRANSDGSLQPFIFTMGAHEVIPGWEQATYGMKAGGSRLLIVPPGVGYGANGQGSVPPNAVLVFQVQLLQVQ